MALNTITSAAISAGATSYPGPFRDGNGNLYVVAQVTATGGTIDVWKSDDGGSTWSIQDSADNPASGTSGDYQALAAVQDGDTLHIATHERFRGGKTQNSDVRYHTFTTSDHATTSDQWVITDEAIVTVDVGDSADVLEADGIEIAVRSDGDVIVFHPGSHNTDMGTEYFNLSYSRREGGSWTTDIALNTEANNQQLPRAVMAPNDECHFHYRVISINNTYAATLDSANSISTRFDVGFDTIADGSARPVTFDPDGTQRIVIAHTIVNVPTKIEVRRLQENGSGDIATETGQTVVTINDSAIPTGLVNMGLAWDSVNGDVYGFWRGTDSDLFYDKSADGDDANWTTDVEQEDAVTINGVWANYYNETIGYVVLDVTTLKYGELDLSTAAVTRLPFARRQLTTVRM